MYAIVDIAGQQFKVQKDSKIYVHRQKGEEGQEIEFEKVLLIDHDGKIDIGAPYVDGARVAATVIKHLQGDKVHVFKKKRRKGYQKLNNHRQQLTQIMVDEILEKGQTRSVSANKTAPKTQKKEEVVAEATVTKTAKKKSAKE